MRKILMSLILIMVLIVGCGSSSSVSKNEKEVRIGEYSMHVGNNSILYLYADGVAGYLEMGGLSGMPTYEYKIKDNKIILTNNSSNEVVMIFDKLEDGNLKRGDDVFYYEGKKDIGNYSDKGEFIDAEATSLE